MEVNYIVIIISQYMYVVIMWYTFNLQSCYVSYISIKLAESKIIKLSIGYIFLYIYSYTYSEGRIKFSEYISDGKEKFIVGQGAQGRFTEGKALNSVLKNKHLKLRKIYLTYSINTHLNEEFLFNIKLNQPEIKTLNIWLGDGAFICLKVEGSSKDI